MPPGPTSSSKPGRPSFGRSKAERGLDQYDTPPIALAPLFAHEPLLAGVRAVTEPFAGRGNLVLAMRQRGLTVFASDIVDRGCPDSAVLDFRDMTAAPCPVLISNPPYALTTDLLEHAMAIGFRVVIFLLTTNYVHTSDRLARVHRLGHLIRVHVLAERLQGMHDSNFTGKTASQSQVHSWFTFARDHYGPAVINPVSLHRPDERMPWAGADNAYRAPRAVQDALRLAQSRPPNAGKPDSASLDLFGTLP
jgi:hypothetical protein